LVKNPVLSSLGVQGSSVMAGLGKGSRAMDGSSLPQLDNPKVSNPVGESGAAPTSSRHSKEDGDNACYSSSPASYARSTTSGASVEGPRLPRWIHDPTIDTPAMYGAYQHYLHQSGQESFLYRIHHRFDMDDVIDLTGAIPCTDLYCQRCFYGWGGYMFRWYHECWYDDYCKMAKQGSWRLPSDGRVSQHSSHDGPPPIIPAKLPHSENDVVEDQVSPITPSESEQSEHDGQSDALKALRRVAQIYAMD
jgi:hypothetical protein